MDEAAQLSSFYPPKKLAILLARFAAVISDASAGVCSGYRLQPAEDPLELVSGKKKLRFDFPPKPDEEKATARYYEAESEVVDSLAKKLRGLAQKFNIPLPDYYLPECNYFCEPPVMEFDLALFLKHPDRFEKLVDEMQAIETRRWFENKALTGAAVTFLGGFSYFSGKLAEKHKNGNATIEKLATMAKAGSAMGAMGLLGWEVLSYASESNTGRERYKRVLANITQALEEDAKKHNGIYNRFGRLFSQDSHDDRGIDI